VCTSCYRASGKVVGGQLKGYDVEERGLQIMLNEAVVEWTKSEVPQDKQMLAKWETLFGKREACSSFYKAAECDVVAFIAIRGEGGHNFQFFKLIICQGTLCGWVCTHVHGCVCVYVCGLVCVHICTRVTP
jgi:hypothetical protein